MTSLEERSKVRVVIFYSRAGAGHLSAARALATELESIADCSVRLVDAYVECGRFPATLFPAAYAQLTRYHPRLWSLIYGVTEKNLNPAPVVGPLVRTGFKNVITEQRPDLIISVIPAINGILASLKAGARLEVVLTDWAAVHPYWVDRGVDHYTVPTDAARNDCIRFGAPPDLVDVVGIPVRGEFTHLVPATAGLTPDPQPFTILAMVGAEGSARTVDSLARLAASDLEAQLVVICGRSIDLRQRMQNLPTRMPLKALGFVADVAGLMCAADLLVTKAGGLTLAEALCVGVPVVVYDAVPGQEVGNLRYMLRHDAVAYAPRPSELVRVISELMRDPKRRESLARRGHQLARPRAAADIATNVLSRLDR